MDDICFPLNGASTSPRQLIFLFLLFVCFLLFWLFFFPTDRSRSQGGSEGRRRGGELRHRPPGGNPTRSTDPKLVACRVFVGNLPNDQLEPGEVEAIFGKHGKVIGESRSLVGQGHWWPGQGHWWVKVIDGRRSMVSQGHWWVRVIGGSRSLVGRGHWLVLCRVGRLVGQGHWWAKVIGKRALYDRLQCFSTLYEMRNTKENSNYLRNITINKMHANVWDYCLNKVNLNHLSKLYVLIYRLYHLRFYDI